MNLTPTAAAIGTVPRHFSTTRKIRRQVMPVTFGMYLPGSLYPGVYEDVVPEVMEGADQPELTDHSGPTSGVEQ